MIATSMMSAKSATPGLLKIKAFLNEGYDAIIYAHDVPIKFHHVTEIML